jgi:hypothetical protein
MNAPVRSRNFLKWAGLSAIVCFCLFISYRWCGAPAASEPLQMPLWSTSLKDEQVGYGGVCTAVSDFDNDGRQDVAITAYSKLGLRGGFVEILASRTGDQIARLSPALHASSFGKAVLYSTMHCGSLLVSADSHITQCATVPIPPNGSLICNAAPAYSGWNSWIESAVGIGDINADLIEDVVIGTGGSRDAGPCGSVALLVSEERTVQWRVVGELSGDRLGLGVVVIHDIDSDGLRDIAAVGSGVCVLVSSRSGERLASFRGGQSFGTAVAACPDMTRDGVPDLCISEPREPKAGGSGSVQLIDGRTFAVTHSFVGNDTDELFGDRLWSIEDCDGDGMADLCAASYGEGGQPRLSIIGSSTANVIASQAVAVGGEYIMSGCLVGDVDGDGFGDLVLGMNRGSNPREMFGYVMLFSLGDLWRADA